MKKNKNARYLSILILVLFCLFGCEKASYLTEEGVHVAEVNQTTYDYLASHPNHMFDTLLMIVDHFNLRDEINNAQTFFAPSDYSIHRYYQSKQLVAESNNPNAVYSLDEFLDDINVDSVRAYLYNGGQYSLENANTAYTYMGNHAAIDSFAYHKTLQAQGAWSYQPIYYLYYVKVRGVPDNVNDDGVISTAPGDEADVRILCQTTGIKTASGTLLNVLANTHNFISDFNLPPRRATYEFDVSFPADAVNYSGTSITLDRERVAAFLGITPNELSTGVGNSVEFNAVEADGELNPNSTANAPGHWFDRYGDVTNWGDNAVLFCEYNAATFTFNIGQYPGHVSAGDQFTVRQAMISNDARGRAVATFVFNITIE